MNIHGSACKTINEEKYTEIFKRSCKAKRKTTLHETNQLSDKAIF